MSEYAIEFVAEIALLLVASLNVLTATLLAFLADLPRVNGGKQMVRLLFWSQAVAWLFASIIAVQAMYTPNSDGLLLVLLAASGTVSFGAKVKVLWWLRY